MKRRCLTCHTEKDLPNIKLLEENGHLWLQYWRCGHYSLLQNENSTLFHIGSFNLNSTGSYNSSLSRLWAGRWGLMRRHCCLQLVGEHGGGWAKLCSGGYDDGARGNGYKPLPDPVPFLGAGINYSGARALLSFLTGIFSAWRSWRSLYKVSLLFTAAYQSVRGVQWILGVHGSIWMDSLEAFSALKDRCFLSPFSFCSIL